MFYIEGGSTFVYGEFCLQNSVYLGVKSRRKFVYMKGQHSDEFCIHMSSRCIHFVGFGAMEFQEKMLLRFTDL